MREAAEVVVLFELGLLVVLVVLEELGLFEVAEALEDPDEFPDDAAEVEVTDNAAPPGAIPCP